MRIGTQARSFGEGIYKEESQFLSVLHDAGALGFEGIESNWKNLERYFEQPEAFGAILAQNGLALIGAHCGGAIAEAAAVDGLLEDARRISAFVRAVAGEFVVFSGAPPKVGGEVREVWARIAERLNQVGRICRDNGAKLTCHNHWWEPAGIGFDTLVRCTDPALVGFAFDTGHYTRAGGDAAAAIAELGDRIALVHLADWDGNRRPPLGRGLLDLDAVRAALVRTGFSGWLVLEEETQFGNATDHVAACVEVLRGCSRSV